MSNIKYACHQYKNCKENCKHKDIKEKELGEFPGITDCPLTPGTGIYRCNPAIVIIEKDGIAEKYPE